MGRRPLTIVAAHNYYQSPGGEDEAYSAEVKLLESHGHTVVRFNDTNQRIHGMGKMELLGATIWNAESHARLKSLVRQLKADVVHFHNTFPLLSPSCYYAAHEAGAAVVHTLHNYRMLCPNATLFRSGAPCQDCLGKFLPWPAVLHGCYRESRAASAAASAMLAAHRAIGSWKSGVDIYVSLTEFARSRFVAAGFPERSLFVKPNFVHPDPGTGSGGGYALFVGRLSEGKGVDTMLAAWAALRGSFSLKIVGDGPLGISLRERYGTVRAVEWLGHMPREAVLELMKTALILIFPSTSFEGLPMTILEAYAVGLPVVASDVGSMSGLIDNGRTGILFRASDPQDLEAKLRWAFCHPVELAKMRRGARAHFETNYTADANYPQLLAVYRMAMDHRSAHAC